MRNLVILRGAPGCGKSTWIKENNLEPYTLCADTLRLMFQSPEPGLEKDSLFISQSNDNDVWAFLYKLMAKRMERGELVIVDATHSKRSDFSRYNDICAKFRYRRFYVDFSDVPIETCKKQNRMRSPEKIVPDKVIDKVYARMRTQESTSGWVELDKNNFREEIDVKCFNFDKYEHIHIFGDIHGCNTALQEYFAANAYSEEDFYIFTGDYLDRGIENKEVLEFLMDFSEKKNVLCLTGNHERWIGMFGNDEFESIRSKEFKARTLAQIIDTDKKKVRSFYRSLGQLAFIEYRGKKYFITHAGISYFPKSIFTFATENFIKGVGDYETDIDEVWDQNETEIIQVHGHRNALGIDHSENKRSYNLEGSVEFGGFLKVLKLSEAGEEIIKIKNEVFGRNNEEPEVVPGVTDTMSVLEQLQNSADIEEKDLGNNIHSFNFSREVFYKGIWNRLTTHARGLFVDVKEEKIVARSYEKFFNVGQRHADEILNLLKKFRNKKISAYKKENGFLGLVSVVNDDFFIASKSTNTGDYADWFRDIWSKLDIDRDYIKDYIQNHNVTLVFEVIDPVRDPHIIKYDNEDAILLDIVYNTWEFKKEDFKALTAFAKKAGLSHKALYAEFANDREFFKWYNENTQEDDLSKTDIEGVVIECEIAPGQIYMTKIKFPYYLFWKSMRGVADKVRRGVDVKYASLWNTVSNYFFAWLKKRDEDILQKDIITLRDRFYSEEKRVCGE